MKGTFVSLNDICDHDFIHSHTDMPQSRGQAEYQAPAVIDTPHPERCGWPSHVSLASFSGPPRPSVPSSASRALLLVGGELNRPHSPKTSQTPQTPSTPVRQHCPVSPADQQGHRLSAHARVSTSTCLLFLFLQRMLAALQLPKILLIFVRRAEVFWRRKY